MPINQTTISPLSYDQSPMGAFNAAYGSMARSQLTNQLMMQEQAKAAIAPQMAKQSLDQAVQSTLQSTIHTHIAKQKYIEAQAAANQATRLVGPTVALKYYQGQVQQQTAALTQKQTQLAGQQTQLAAAKTNIANTGAQVAAATKGYAIQQAMAAAKQKISEAKTAKEHAKYLPSEISAKNISAVTGMANVSASHPYQRSLNPGVIKNVNSAIGGVLKNPLAVPTTNANSNPSSSGKRPTQFHLTNIEINKLPTTMWNGQLVHVDPKTGLHYPIALNMGFSK